MGEKREKIHTQKNYKQQKLNCTEAKTVKMRTFNERGVSRKAAGKKKCLILIVFSKRLHFVKKKICSSLFH